MATHIVDERKLLASGFTLEGRNLIHGESLWSRADEPDRSYKDTEAIAYLDERKKESD
jgi:hypothetical protein